MAILRINKKGNFVILDKTCLNQSHLTWGAKGLHAYLMGLPDDCHILVAKLVEKGKNGRDAVRGYLNELEKAGYITKEWIRKEGSGIFDRLEYVVHELPQKHHENSPSTDNPSPDNPSQNSQAPDSSSPEKTTAIISNNKNINNKNNKITAAASYSQAQEQTFTKQQAAAVFSNEKASNDKVPGHLSQPIAYLSPDDAVIGDTLTHNQVLRIDSQVKKLNSSDSERLAQEIRYCLVNPNHFTACGQDFSRKLNAILTVIRRGEWQTPAGMVLDEKQPSSSALRALQSELQEAYAEVNHFQRLLNTMKEGARENVETIIQNSKNKISQIEEKICQRIVNKTKEKTC